MAQMVKQFYQIVRVYALYPVRAFSVGVSPSGAACRPVAVAAVVGGHRQQGARTYYYVSPGTPREMFARLVVEALTPLADCRSDQTFPQSRSSFRRPCSSRLLFIEYCRPPSSSPPPARTSFSTAPLTYRFHHAYLTLDLRILLW
ncbi:Hypothetical protein CINCED_3A011421 [Cinara cedri]|uniref:Uncharacterized protein n=1 Tax=Cinara cedri TaxID=506608 RepID=A0A5E4N4Q7_9HEMI|nr:Hypothetical protein CINCED_3A011421 [Cinara cedri]